MTKKQLKKNRICFLSPQTQRGFVVLFAVVLSSIILAIALGVANIAIKEINFSTSARETNDAFFAADTGAECALYFDRYDVDAFIKGVDLNCNGSVISNSGTTSPWRFYIENLGSQGNSCVSVIVEKFTDENDFLKTTITAKGYSRGSGTGNSCSPEDNSVERVLEVNY